MPEYIYKAQGQDGNTLKGKMEALNETDVAQALRAKGYYPIEIKQSVSRKELGLKIFSRIRIRDVAIFSRQFAAIVGAGLTIASGLDILAQQTESKRLRRVISKVLEEIQKGKSLSEAMSQSGEFPQLFINMLQAGEISGQLEEILDRMAIYYEKESKLREKIKSALMYPMILSIVSVFVVIFLVIKVLPVFVNMFDALNIELPLPTKILLDISLILTKYWYIIVFVVIFTACFIVKYISHGKGRYRYHTLLLKLPILGKINRTIVTSRFARTLAILLNSGTPVIQAMETLEKTITNAVIEDGIAKTKEDIKKGVGLSKAMSSIWVFPPLIISMMHIGEETGMLDTMLSKTAQFYDEEVDIAVTGLTTLIEPVIIVFLGGIVGFIIVSVIMPLFQIYSSMG